MPETANHVAGGSIRDGARAAVLAHLWGALRREPIPGVATGRLAGPAAPAGRMVDLDRIGCDDPGELARGLGLAGLAAEPHNSGVELTARGPGIKVPAARAEALPHKALLGMRLAADWGDSYVRVENPPR